MALQFFDGFEWVATIRKPEWSSAGIMQVATGRDGSGSSALSSNGSTAPVLTLPSPAATVIVGFGILPKSTTFGNTVAEYLSIRTGATTHLTINANATGNLVLRSGGPAGTILATSGAGQVLADSVWRHMQVKATIHTSTGTCVVKIDDVAWINYTGATGASTTNIDGLAFRTHTTASVNWDDLWVCDGTDGTTTQGSANNDFLGDLKVSRLLPNADGASSQFVGNDGNSVSNYLQVDENRTDHYVGSSVPGNRDLYGLPDLPGTAVTVFGVQVVAYVSKSDAGAAGIKTLAREPDGTVVASGTTTLSTTPLASVGPRAYKKSSGAVWSVADIAALQVGVEATA